jgi:hypothetical protein
MNDLSTLGMLIMTDQRNTMSLFAGDDDSGMGNVFNGTMYEVFADFNSMPQVSLRIRAQTGLTDAIKPVSPLSYQGGVDVVTIMAGLATVMGRLFENNGVTGRYLSHPYYAGCAAQQVVEVANDADIAHYDDGRTLAIWPKNGSRGGAIPKITPESGLVGYPSYTANGIDIVTLFNSAISFGGKVEVKSSLPQATGIWQVYGLEHALESETPGGEWFSRVRLYRPGYIGGTA